MYFEGNTRRNEVTPFAPIHVWCSKSHFYLESVETFHDSKLAQNYRSREVGQVTQDASMSSSANFINSEVILYDTYTSIFFLIFFPFGSGKVSVLCGLVDNLMRKDPYYLVRKLERKSELK